MTPILSTARCPSGQLVSVQDNDREGHVDYPKPTPEIIAALDANPHIAKSLDVVYAQCVHLTPESDRGKDPPDSPPTATPRLTTLAVCDGAPTTPQAQTDCRRHRLGWRAG